MLAHLIQAEPAVSKPRDEGRAQAAPGVEMLPWAATASPAATPATAAISLASLLRVAVLRPPRPLFRPPPLLLLRAGLRAPPRAASSDGNVFWEEPDDGSGSDYEDEVEEENERRRNSSPPSPSPFSRLEAARQQEQELRRGIGRFACPDTFTSFLLLHLLYPVSILFA